jgi:predicted exporter
MLFRHGSGPDAQWRALLPLGAPPSGLEPAAVRTALAAAGVPDALFVDLKAESDNLYAGYLHEAILLSLGGLGAIVVLLLITLRAPLRVARILLPLLAAVVAVVALLALAGERLTILHLIGLLLIVAVGSNYALFFSKGEAEAEPAVAPQTLASLVFANLTTVAGFGILGFSQVPVLHAIGATVGPGAVLALVFSACFARHAAAVDGRQKA